MCGFCQECFRNEGTVENEENQFVQIKKDGEIYTRSLSISLGFSPLNICILFCFVSLKHIIQTTIRRVRWS